MERHIVSHVLSDDKLSNKTNYKMKFSSGNILSSLKKISHSQDLNSREFSFEKTLCGPCWRKGNSKRAESRGGKCGDSVGGSVKEVEEKRPEGRRGIGMLVSESHPLTPVSRRIIQSITPPSFASSSPGRPTALTTDLK